MDKIARSALAALKTIDRLRQNSNKKLPLAWCPSVSGWNVVEVYPAVTKIADGAPKDGVGRIGPPNNNECPQHLWKASSVMRVMHCFASLRGPIF